jgi:hypothetical protein
MKQLSSKQIIIGPVRFSYLTVFKPRMNDLKTPPVAEYSAILLIPKDGNDFLKDPKAELQGFANAVKGVLLEHFNGKAPDGWLNPLKDGDKEKNTQGEPKCPGYWFIKATASAEYPPALVTSVNGQLVKVTDGWGSGDWGEVKLNLSGYAHKSGNKGVFCGLNAIKFTRKDVSLGGGAASADGFDVDAPQSQDDDYDPFEGM